MNTTETIIGKLVYRYPADGPVLSVEQDANELIGSVYGQEIDVLAIPVDRLSDEFYALRTGFAGAFIQKLQNYGFRLAVVGDIGKWVAGSNPLRDFVFETNRRGHHLFVADLAELRARL